MTHRATTQVCTYQVCGVQIAAVNLTEAAEILVRTAASKSACEVHLCNAYTLSLVDQDPTLSVALSRAHLNIPDGTPVAWLGRRRGTKGPVRGPSLVGAVASIGVVSGLRHYFYGGQEKVAEEMSARLERHAPGLQVAGCETPPYHALSEDDVADLARRVTQSGANIVWIGLGTPKQDYLVPRLANYLQLPIVPVGAAFDFWSGRVKEAPSYLQGSGMEWIHRFAREPKRLWRRYLVGNPRFLYSAAAHRFGGFRDK